VRGPEGERRGGAGSERRVGARDAVRRRRDAAEEQPEQQQPDDAQLGGGLQLERVRVADGVVELAVLEPRDGERPGAAAGRGIVGERLDRGLPVLDPVAAAGGEALRAGAERGRRSRAVAAVGCGGGEGEERHDRGGSERERAGAARSAQRSSARRLGLLSAR